MLTHRNVFKLVRDTDTVVPYQVLVTYIVPSYTAAPLHTSVIPAGYPRILYLPTYLPT